MATFTGKAHGTIEGVSIHATLAGGDPEVRLSSLIIPVSIHATLAGGDADNKKATDAFWSFYPRHPRGWRQDRGGGGSDHRAVSIHATLAGGDGRVLCIECQHRAFLSTPPSRVATGGDGLTADGRWVSIHATLAGGDLVNSMWQVPFL